MGRGFLKNMFVKGCHDSLVGVRILVVHLARANFRSLRQSCLLLTTKSSRKWQISEPTRIFKKMQILKRMSPISQANVAKCKIIGESRQIQYHGRFFAKCNIIGEGRQILYHGRRSPNAISSASVSKFNIMVECRQIQYHRRGSPNAFKKKLIRLNIRICTYTHIWAYVAFTRVETMCMAMIFS